MIEISKYKSKPQIDRVAYYTPYVPLQMVRHRDLIDSVGEFWVKLHFLPNEILEWVQQNDIHCKIVFDTNVVYFYNNADLTAFYLRWAGT